MKTLPNQTPSVYTRPGVVKDCHGCGRPVVVSRDHAGAVQCPRCDREDVANVFAALRQLDTEALTGLIAAADHLGEQATAAAPVYDRLIDLASQELLRRVDEPTPDEREEIESAAVQQREAEAMDGERFDGLG